MKLQHFEPDPVSSRDGSFQIPGRLIVRKRIERIRNLLPGSIATVTLTRGDKSIDVHFVAVGFGAAVPFYRRAKLTDEFRQAFLDMGFGSSGIPTYFYGNDLYPAGRLMNRRVEINLVW